MRGDTQEIGCRFLVCETTGEDVARAAGGLGVLASAKRAWPLLRAGRRRFLCNVVVRSEGVPALLPDESLLFSGDPTVDSPYRPALRLLQTDLAGVTRWAVEALVSPDFPTSELRALVLSGLVLHFPFLERHLVVVDSPHDGLPAWVYADGERREVPRLSLPFASREGEAMPAQWLSDTWSWNGLSAEPVRGPIARTFLIGPTVLPSLGQEGELLSAETAAWLITKADPSRQRMRIDLFGRVELG